MEKVVFLDIDDTLLSFEVYVKEAMKTGFDEFGIGPYKEEMLPVFHKVNSSLWHKLEKGELSFENLKKIRWNLVFEALGLKADGVKFEEYFRLFLFDSAIPEEGAFDLLKYLKEKYTLCAASNGPYLQQVNRLKVGGMLPYFDHLFISEEIGFSKPSLEFFAVCMKRLNGGDDTVSIEDVVMIGDSLTSDMAGAIRAGIKTIFYNCKKQEIPPEIKPDFIVYNLKEIQGIL